MTKTLSENPMSNKKSNISNDGFGVWLKFIWKAHITNPLWHSGLKRRHRREGAYTEMKSKYLEKYIPFIKDLKINTTNHKEDKSSEKVFVMWLQGEDKAPEIVK